MGGSWQKSRLSVGLFDFNFLVLNILKEADINFFFKVLAKFEVNKHNKDIKKNMKKKCFFFHRRGVGGGKIWMENSITFNVFLLKPSLTERRKCLKMNTKNFTRKMFLLISWKFLRFLKVLKWILPNSRKSPKRRWGRNK